MPNEKEKPTSKDQLATEIAKAFQEGHRTELYRYIFQGHNEAVIKKAFEDTKKVPADKIKKTRSALFFFLLNKYAEK
jgi:hypothetical protein